MIAGSRRGWFAAIPPAHQPFLPSLSKGGFVDSTQDGGHPPPQYFDSLRYRLFKRLVGSAQPSDGGGVLDTRAWNYAAEWGHPVGECRQCGHQLFALPTEVVGRITWYTAQCRQCGKEIASPNADLLIRSSRWDEMPSGFAEGRKKPNRGV